MELEMAKFWSFYLMIASVLCATNSVGYVLDFNKLQVKILALVPLSGDDQLKGQAQLAGITLAIQEDLHRLNNIPSVQVSFAVNDTQCDAGENRLLLDSLMSTRGVVVVLGGDCSKCEGSPPACLSTRPDYMSRSLPRISFDDHSRCASLRPSVTLKESVMSGHNDIVDYILTNNWTRVALIHESSSFRKMGSERLIRQLGDAGVNVSLTSDSSTYNILDVIQGSDLRIIITYLPDEAAASLICSNPARFNKRYVWITVTMKKSILVNRLTSVCSNRLAASAVVVFRVIRSPLRTGEFQIFQHLVTTDDTFKDRRDLQRDAGYSYEAAKLVLENLRLLVTSRSLGELEDREEFTGSLVRSILNRSRSGVMGVIDFTEDGYRRVSTEVTVIGEPANMDTQTVSPVTELAGIPLSLFIIVCALSLLGIIYSIAILIFNVIKQKDKIIKMTSPNINVIVLLGAVFGYASLVLMGLDSSRVSLETMAKLLQGGIFILVLSVTFIYGATFTKSWRVYMIFKNVNANGKLTRDEHLILGLAILVLLDLAILLPWTLVDPISCTQIELSTRYESGRQSDVRTLVDECSSSMLGVWVGVIFGYKAVILGVGCFFTWQTRHVTLPALQDTKEVYLCIFALVSMALVCMPALLTSSIGMTVRYATGSVAVWLTITATITLLFVPKIILYRNSVKEGQKDLKFQFKESMEKTREAVGKCLFCFCCTEKEEDDKYAQEMLHSEIDTLKRTIKEKDSTIRELTDRLYIGTEKFQEYLVSPKRNTTLEAMRRKHERRAKSMHTPASRHKYKLEKQRGMPRHLSLDYEEEGEDDAGLGYMRGEMPACMVDPDTGTFPLPREERTTGRDGGSLRRQYHERGPDISVINVDQGVNNPNYAGGNPRLGGGGSGQGLPTPAMYTHHTLAAHSPNHDSAIDNNSPSSDTGSSERGDYNNGGFARDDSFKRRADAYSAPIDLEAMESDATNNAAGWPQEPELNNSRAHHPEVRTPNRSLVNHIELEPYRTARINGVSVSQI